MEYKIVYKDGSDKYVEISPDMSPLSCPSDNMHGFAYRVDQDAVKVYHDPTRPGIVRMLQRDVEYLMENDEVHRHIHPNGVLYRVLGYRRGLVYAGSTSEFKEKSILPIRNFQLRSDLFYNYMLLSLDNIYYYKKRIAMGDAGTHNVIRTVNDIFLIDNDYYGIGVNRLNLRNAEQLNALMFHMMEDMIDVSADDTSIESCQGIDEVKTRLLRVKTSLYTPLEFASDFGAYKTMDEYLLDNGVKVKNKLAA